MERNTSKTNILNLTPLAAALLISPPLFSSKVHAEESVNNDVERIMVTGTRRNDRTVSESTVPVDILDQETITATGQLEVSQILSSLLPSFNYPQATINDGTDHSRPAVLRGLSPDHTLVLINGKRRHSSALLNLGGSVGRGSSAVDLNMIPASAIKSIQVLRDGAAAQYGSDAIAGVINIILKDGSEGGNLTVNYGQYETKMAGVADLKSVSVTDDGNLGFVTGSDRQRSDGQSTTITGDVGFEIGDQGFLHLALEVKNKDATNRSGFDKREQFARINGELDPRELTFNRYNHKFGKPEIDATTFIYNFGMPINSEMELYSFGSYGVREGLSAGFYRRAKDGRNVPEVYSEGFLPHISSDVKDLGFNIGVKGETSDWNWDISLTHGKSDFGFGVENSINTSIGVNSPIEFDNGSVIYEQTLFNADVQRYVDIGLSSEASLAFGAEYRTENYQIKSGEEASYITKLDGQGNPIAAGGAQVLSGFSPSSEVDKGRHNYAVYAELDADLTESLNAVFAARVEKYSDFGNTFDSKLAMRWELSDNLSFRGAVSTGFRAPSLAQVNYTSVATVFEDGIPNEVGLYPSTDKAAQALGAKALEAENSVNATIGAVFQLDSFNLTLDAYNIKIDDRIVLSENLSGTEVQNILATAGINDVQRVRYFTNAIDTETKGIDIVATYDFSLAQYGELSLSAAANFNETEVTGVKDNPAELVALGDSYQFFAQREITRFEQGTPKNKYNLAAKWSWDDLIVNLRTTRFGEVTDASSNPDNHEVLPAIWITDIDVNYSLTENLRLTLGSNNLFDQYPLDTVSNVGESTFNQIFAYSGFSSAGIDGRFVYGKISYSF